jgi:hypothetical protein
MSLDQRPGRGWSPLIGVDLTRAFPLPELVPVGTRLFALVRVWLSSRCHDFTCDTGTGGTVAPCP